MCSAENAKTVRVLVANRPRLMRDLLLATLAERPGIEVVGEVENESDIRGRIELTMPDCLILTLDQSGARPAMCDALLRDFPNMRILALSAEDGSGMFFWASFDIHSRRVEASEEGVLSALRETLSNGVNH